MKDIRKIFKENGFSDVQIDCIKFTINHSDIVDNADYVEMFDGIKHDSIRVETKGLTSICKDITFKGKKYSGIMSGIIRNARNNNSPMLSYYKGKADRTLNIPACEEIYLNKELLGSYEEIVEWAKS